MPRCVDPRARAGAGYPAGGRARGPAAAGQLGAPRPRQQPQAGGEGADQPRHRRPPPRPGPGL